MKIRAFRVKTRVGSCRVWTPAPRLREDKLRGGDIVVQEVLLEQRHSRGGGNPRVFTQTPGGEVEVLQLLRAYEPCLPARDSRVVERSNGCPITGGAACRFVAQKINKTRPASGAKKVERAAAFIL